MAVLVDPLMMRGVTPGVPLGIDAATYTHELQREYVLVRIGRFIQIGIETRGRRWRVRRRRWRRWRRDIRRKGPRLAHVRVIPRGVERGIHGSCIGLLVDR